MLARCVDAGWSEPAVWFGFVPLEGDLQSHSRSGMMEGVAPSVKDVGVQTVHLSVLAPYLD